MVCWTVYKCPGDVSFISFQLNSPRALGTLTGCQWARLRPHLTGPRLCGAVWDALDSLSSKLVFSDAREQPQSGRMSASSDREINQWCLREQGYSRLQVFNLHSETAGRNQEIKCRARSPWHGSPLTGKHRSSANHHFQFTELPFLIVEISQSHFHKRHFDCVQSVFKI